MAAESGVLAIKNLPHGFFEQQLLGFFSQFGTVEYVRVRRSRKSGHSCGVGYVKFEVPEVAAIAGKSMDNYTMFGMTLRCEVKSVEWEKARPAFFLPQNAASHVRKMGRSGFVEERDRRLGKRFERAREMQFTSYEAYLWRCHRMVENDKLLAQKIRAAGIDYSYPALTMDARMEKEWRKCETKAAAEAEEEVKEKRKSEGEMEDEVMKSAKRVRLEHPST